ncbi:MAG TPA: hypothetical protein VFG73_08490 [Rhodanobacteraceae bacterium]|nr:hypothetical protein [Rhodanobacteraceae bacterium]
MTRFRACAGRLVLALAVIGLATLAGCSSHNVRPATVAAEQAQYDMVLVAYKDGQFQLDGGVLAVPDLEGHFAYLDSAGKLPQTVLLRDGTDSVVRSPHLREVARLQGKYGFKAFVEHDGELKPLTPEDGK